MNAETPDAATVTAIDCVALRPPGSRAVTVTVAVPAATGASVAVLPETETLTMLVRLERAVYVSRSPSGSVKYRATFTDAALPPTVSVCAGIEPMARGGWLVPPSSSTVTAMVCVALAPSGSRAVTVTVAVPAVTGASVTVLPDTEALTTPALLERAV